MATCACGNAVSSLSKSSLCSICRDQSEKEKLAQKRREKHEARLSAAKEANLSLVHSCIGPFDPPLENCRCKRFVSNDEALRLVLHEGAVLFRTRQNIYIRGEQILEIGRRKRPPASSLGGRIGIERQVAGEKIPQTAEAIKQLKANRAEEREWLAAERRAKVEIEAELLRDALKAITIFVDEDEWRRNERESRGIPTIPLPAFKDERSSVGQDCGLLICFDQKAA